ncbi:MAG: metal ABC transporter permease [Actinobacteria bacterium]|nr:metal ABC transporter permease [Actinomycetota bacterium]
MLGAACGALGVWLLHLRHAYAAESLAHAMLPGLVVAALTAGGARRGTLSWKCGE